MYFLEGRTHCIDLCLLLRSSLRKQPTVRDDTPGVPGAKWHLRNVCRNSVLMTRHYPHLGSAFTHVALSCAEASLYCGEAFVRFLFFSTIDILMGKRGLCGGESPRGRTNQKHYPELGTYTSSVWNFCSRMSVVISWGNQWTLARYCSRECLLHFWSLFHHPKTLWCLRIPWITIYLDEL